MRGEISQPEQDELDRPLWGCKAIAEDIDRSQRQTFYMLEAGHLPASKVGSLWVTTRRRLRDKFSGEAA